MAHYLHILGATLGATGPIFVLILLGLACRRWGLVDDAFVTVSSRLVFNLCLPVLLFTNIIRLDLAATLELGALLYSLLATLGGFALSWLLALLWVRPVQDRGVFVQACFRGNLAVIGIALCASAYGEAGLAIGALLMAVMTILYNILSVIVLAFYAETGTASWRSVVHGIVTNPLIIAIVLALLVAWLRLPIPELALATGSYLGSMALPLALLGSGAGLSMKVLRDSSYVTALGVTLKLALLPLLMTLGAWWLGFTGTVLGVMFLMFVSPTAVASFVMAKSMGGNDRLAANLVMTTTLGSVLTTSLGLFILKLLALA